MKGFTVAPLSTASSAASAKPSATAVVQPSLTSPQSSSTVFFIRYDHDGPGVAIRDAPFYPGKRTRKQISAGHMVAVSEFKRISHIDADRKSHIIKFYRLADGRGWVHDFCPTTSKVAFSRVLTTSPSSAASFIPPATVSFVDTMPPAIRSASVAVVQPTTELTASTPDEYCDNFCKEYYAPGGDRSRKLMNAVARAPSFTSPHADSTRTSPPKSR